VAKAKSFLKVWPAPQYIIFQSKIKKQVNKNQKVSSSPDYLFAFKALFEIDAIFYFFRQL
jgi:hypothetical protein